MNEGKQCLYFPRLIREGTAHRPATDAKVGLGLAVADGADERLVAGELVE
jgi:hypothetical protein